MNRIQQTNTSTSSKSQWSHSLYLPQKSAFSGLKAQKRSTRDLAAPEAFPAPTPVSTQPPPQNTQPALKLKLQSLVAGMAEREQFLDDLGELRGRQVGEGQLKGEASKDCVEFNSYPIPEEIMERYKKLDPESYVQKGLLEALHCAYFILQDTLILWKVNNEANLYDSLSIQSDSLCVLSFSQQVQAVQLFPNRDKFYPHPFMLVLALESSFALYNLSPQLQHLLVQQDIPKGGLITNCIQVSADNRIFFGGSSDAIQELECNNREYRVRNYRPALDRGLLLENLRNKIKDYRQLLRGKEVVQISVDSSRQLVYALTKTAADLSSIQVYDCADCLTYLFQVTDRQLKEQVNKYEQLRDHVSIDYITCIPLQESKSLALVAVSAGLRVFLELCRPKESLLDRPSLSVRGLRVAFVKPLSSEHEGLCVYLGKWGRRWVVLSQGEDQLLQCQMVSQQRAEREVTQKVDLQLEEEDLVMGQVQQWSEPGLAQLVQQSGAAYSQALGEQQFSGPFHLMVLTHRMLHLVLQLRPIDTLYSALLSQDHLAVHHLRQSHGLPALCTMLLQLVVQEESEYFQLEEGQVSGGRACGRVRSNATHLFHFFCLQANETSLGTARPLQNPFLTSQLREDQYGRALESQSQQVTVFLESVLTYYTRLTGLVREQSLIDQEVYNYQAQRCLSRLDNCQLGYVIRRLSELADFLKESRPTLMGSQSVCSMVSALLQFYPSQAQQGDLLEETKVLSELAHDLQVQVEWLKAMQLLNCPQLRLLVEQLHPSQIQLLLQQQYKHLFRLSPTGTSLLKNLLVHYLIIEPELFAEKRALCERTFQLVVTEQEVEVAEAMLQLREVVQQQKEQSRLAEKASKQEEEQVRLIRERVHGMDNQSGVARVAGAMQQLRQHVTVLDQYLLNDVFEQLDFLGGYVQFNQLVLAKLNSLCPSAVLFQSLSEVVVALVQDDRHQVLHGLSPQQTQAIHQAVLQDIVAFDNKFLNQEIIAYLFHKQLFQEFLLFPVQDVDTFLEENPAAGESQSEDSLDKAKFLYQYYLHKEEHQSAYELMLRLGHSASLQVQLRLFAFNCAHTALGHQAPQHQQLRVIQEQLRHLQVQDCLGAFLSSAQPEHPALKQVLYSIMSIQEMYDLAHDLDFPEGELMVYDLNNDIQEEVVRELYQKLFCQLLEVHQKSAEAFVQGCQAVLARLDSRLQDHRLLDCALIVNELQNVNYLHPGFLHFLRGPASKKGCSPFWVFPFLREHLTQVSTSNVLSIYVEQLERAQGRVQNRGAGVEEVVEVMFPLNSLQALLQSEIARVDQQLSSNFKQKAMSSFIHQHLKVKNVLSSLQHTLLHLQEHCLIDDDLIQAALSDNQQIAMAYSRLQDKTAIVCKK